MPQALSQEAAKRRFRPTTTYLSPSPTHLVKDRARGQPARTALAFETASLPSAFKE